MRRPQSRPYFDQHERGWVGEDQDPSVRGAPAELHAERRTRATRNHRGTNSFVVKTFFAAGGALDETLPDFEPRPEQAALAEAVEAALSSCQHLIAEAGTGTGKSLAYLVPAIESGGVVVIATATKALQDQLLTKDVPAAAHALGRDVRCAVLKGRENYLCRRSLQGLMLLQDSPEALFSDPALASEFEAMRDWIGVTENGDRAELPFEPSSSLWSEVAVGADRCRKKTCPLVSTCYSELARKQAGEAELVIVNHALYFADLALRGAAGDGTGFLPDHDAVIFDEAHRLEEAAATWFGGRVSIAGVRQLIRDVERTCREDGSSTPTRALLDLERAAGDAIGGLAPRSGRRRLRAPDVEAAAAHSGGFLATLLALADLLRGRSEDHDLLARRATAVADDFELATSTDDRDKVAWAEPGSVSWAPVDVAEILRDRLWDRDDVTAVLISATLEPAFARMRLGLSDALEVVLPSAFDYREQVLLYVPAELPEPREPGYDDCLAAEVAELLTASRGRALVLTTSYRALKEIGNRIAAELPYPLLRQGEAPRERLLEQFRDDVDSVLLATSTFWQGIDVQGESLSLLVIDKLPFSVPDDPLNEARCERIVELGGDWFADYALPKAVLQLRQGFGRLIRGHADEGVVAILDSRLHRRRYGVQFLEALPSCRTATEFRDVEAFFTAQVGRQRLVPCLESRGEEEEKQGPIPAQEGSSLPVEAGQGTHEACGAG